MNINYHCLNTVNEVLKEKQNCESWATAYILSNQKHIVALLRRSELVSIYGETIIDKIIGVTKQVKEDERVVFKEAKPISQVKHVSASKNLKMATWDVETHTPYESPSVYLSGLAWMHECEMKFKSFEGDNKNLERFF